MYNLGIPEELFEVPENVDEMTLKQLQEYEHSLGMIRVRLRKVQVILKERMTKLGQKTDAIPLFVRGVPSSKNVGIPGG